MSGDIFAASPSPSLPILERLFPGQVLIKLADAARCIGKSLKTAHNLGERFPLRTRRNGKFKQVHILDLADFLDAQRVGIADCQVQFDSPPQPPIRRGAPTLVEKKAARLAGYTSVTEYRRALALGKGVSHG